MTKSPGLAGRGPLNSSWNAGGHEGDGTITGTALRDHAHVRNQQGQSANDSPPGSMCFASAMEISLRTGTPADAADCGRICYEAFADVASRHGYKSLFPVVEGGVALLSWMLSAPNFYTVVAEVEDRVVGSGVLQEWDKAVAAIAVISVDPAIQGHGVGEQLMRAMTERAAGVGFGGVRLVQEAYNRHSFSLYTKLGFEVREMLVRFNEQPKPYVIPGYTVRPATLEDVAECDALCIRVHGHDRSQELRYSIDEGAARVVEHDGQISGYMTGLGGGGHVVGGNNQDLKALMASGGELGGNGFLVPARNTALLVWCLAQGLRVAELHTLMGTGLYNEPRGAWLPSFSY